jgi:hypothetical protein
MDTDRSTNGFSPLSWLNIIQRGGTEDWKTLYKQCRDPEVAAKVAGVLPLRDPDLLAAARLWQFLLEDLHPFLAGKIDLRPDRRNIGV